MQEYCTCMLVAVPVPHQKVINPLPSKSKLAIEQSIAVEQHLGGISDESPQACRMYTASDWSGMAHVPDNLWLQQWYCSSQQICFYGWLLYIFPSIHKATSYAEQAVLSVNWDFTFFKVMINRPTCNVMLDITVFSTQKRAPVLSPHTRTIRRPPVPYLATQWSKLSWTWQMNADQIFNSSSKHCSLKLMTYLVTALHGRKAAWTHNQPLLQNDMNYIWFAACFNQNGLMPLTLELV